MRTYKTLIVAVLFVITAAFTSNTSSATDKYVGGDISLLTNYEQNGATYYQTDGTTAITDLLGYFGDCGHNAMRLRLFHNPDNASDDAKEQGVCQSLDYIAALGKRIKDAGMALLLDFHYSDTWADPAKQWIPAAWEGLSDDQLADSVYEYTKYALTFMVANGATPDFIQTGNEITYGMLWDTESSADDSNKFYAGTTDSSSQVYTRFITFLKRAGEACREVCPQAKIVIHTERAADTTYTRNFYQIMEDEQIDYDIIGLSYYPVYHGPMSNISAALDVIDSNFPDKEVMLVEVGYYHIYYPSDATYNLTSTYPDTEAGQLAFTQDLITVLLKHKAVTGLFWWWMEANECGLNWSTKRVTYSWYNASLFDNSSGSALDAIEELQEFLNEASDDSDSSDSVYFHYINDLEWDNIYVAIYDSSWSFVYGTAWATDASYNTELTNIIGTYGDYDVYKYIYEGSSTDTPYYIIFFNGGYGTGNQSSNCVYSQGAYYNSGGLTGLTDDDITQAGITSIISPDNQVRIASSDGALIVSGTDSVRIYNVNGALVSTETSTLLSPGIYIVSTPTVTLKAAVR